MLSRVAVSSGVSGARGLLQREPEVPPPPSVAPGAPSRGRAARRVGGRLCSHDHAPAGRSSPCATRSSLVAASRVVPLTFPSHRFPTMFGGRQAAEAGWPHGL